MAHDIVRNLQDLVGAANAFAIEAGDAADNRRLVGSVVDNQARHSCVVRPEGVEAVQRVMRFAAAHGLGVTVQPGAAGNGTSLAPQGGAAIVLDLRKMNRILEVSRAGAYALVEPGVTYRQLHAHLAQNEPSMWVDCDSNPENSIAGSICARSFGHTPYGDHLLMQCGLEVVLQGGEVLRTGMGALPRSTTWQLFKYNFGPYLDGLLTRTNFAVVSKVGLWLMPAPPTYLPFRVALKEEAALAQAVEVLRPLLISGTLPGTVRISHGLFDLAPYHRRDSFMSGGRVGQAAAFAAGSVGAWNIYGALYGTPQITQFVWDRVREVLHPLSTAEISVGADRAKDPIWKLREGLMRGEPPSSAPSLQHWSGRDYMRISCVAPMEGADALKLWRLVQQIESDEECLCEYSLHGRTMLLNVHLPYSPDNAASVSGAAARAVGFAAALGAAGFGVADESLELRRLFDRHFSGSPVTRFTASLGTAFGPGAHARSTAVGIS